MEPLKILTKELTPNRISLRSRQLPTILNQLKEILPRNRSPTPCRSENGEDANQTLNFSEIPSTTKEHITKLPVSRKSGFNGNLYVKKEVKEIRSRSFTDLQKASYATKKNKKNIDVPRLNLFNQQYRPGCYPEKLPKLSVQQTRFYHKKAEKPRDEVQGISTGILSKEALLNHHAQRNASHFALFDPAVAALNLSALQPSKAGFNVRKLISNSYKENWDWGLPTEFVKVKTKGPGINDNLIDFVDQKMRIQAETKRKFKPVEEKAHSKIRSLMNKARTMNIEAEKLRIAGSTPPENKEKRLIRTVSSVIDPATKKSIDKTGKEKPFQRKLSTFNNTISTNRHAEQEKTATKKDKEEDSSQTAYQPTASYRNVFYNILNKSRRKHRTIDSLSVFNRPALETVKVVPKPATQAAVTNLNSYLSARGKSEKQLDNEGKKSQTSINRSSMKEAPRTPFQKVKDSLFTKTAKASFSTISKTKHNTKSLVSKKKGNKGFSTIANPTALKTGKVIKPKLRNVNYQMRYKSANSAIKTSKLHKNIVKTSTKQAKKAHILERQDSKIFSKTNKQTKTNEFNKQPTRTFFSYHGPNTEIYNNRKNKTQLLMTSPKKESNKTEKSRTIKRNFHMQNCTIFEPIEEKVFHELLNLCDSSNKVGQTGNTKSAKQAFENSCRCTLNEKKPENKKGLVCRIASMFNLGCGSDSRCPPRGCTKCGKH